MMDVIELAMRRSRTVVLSLLVILVSGVVAYLTIPKEAEPDIEIPIVYVSIEHDGISPEDSERLLVRPMEQELRSIEGVKEMTANAYEGGANVQLEFDAGIDTKRALQDVREKVDLAQAKLPGETDEPTVNEVKMSRFDPMLVLNLAGDVPERTLTNVAKDLEEKLEALPGVLEVNLVGTREELMEVVVDPLAMESYGLDQAQIIQFVSRNNRLVAAGALHASEGRFPVKVPGVFETSADVLDMPIKAVGDRVVHFRDIAEVRRTYKDAESVARLNGKPALAIEVIQRSRANVIDTIDEVNAIIDQERQYWPPGMDIVASRDKSKDIHDMLTELQNSVLAAVLLVFIVIIGILGIRSALLVGVAIPGSFLLGILLIGSFGVTINMMVLFALIMAVGLLVDGAIVVTEMADRRLAEGDARHDAYARAAVRMSWPIIASTCTTLAAFVPLALWPGTSGEFMKYLPITLIAVLAASLFMALLFVPTLGAIFGRTGANTEEARRNLANAETGNLDEVTGFTGKYIRFLRATLRRPWLGVAGVSALLVTVYAAFFLFGKGIEYFPDVEQPFGMVDIRARGDMSTEERDRLVREVEARVLDMPEIEFLYAKTGANDQGAEDQIGTLTLNYVDWQERRRADEILAEIRERTSDLVGIRIETRKPDPGPPIGKPIRIEFSSRDYEQLDRAVERVRAHLEMQDDVVNIEDSRPLPGIEWQIKVDRAEAARFGADISLVGAMVQLVTNGIKIGEYRPDDSDDEIDIRVRYPEQSRSLAQIDELRIPSDSGLVPISTFIERVPAQKVGTIRRTDMRRTLAIDADVAPGVLVDDVVRRLKLEVPELGVDARVSLSFRGSTEDQQEDMDFLGRAMLMALAIMAIILVTQFNSIYQALLILTAVLFSTGGVLLGHLLLAKPFGVIMSSVGVITLAGIVVNNNIVFIDTYNVLRSRGEAPFDAVLRTCAVRLRPVLLTTVTTIVGLMPMVLGVNINLIDRDISVGAPSSQWWTQLASSVAGGLAFATLLTLLLTPSLLMIQANAVKRWNERRTAQAVRRGSTVS
ncbi:MAG: efflux RND transporter permease subunit [Gammaproteobacteria bacterium]|nr:efflux RND transporter permease subunit [Gammaproteobacteria bacterium]NNF49354.1 efflux RND transporter permease subunit [Woeseiaceae bacterium]MBT8093573.1 efflux RND transporter permease subunit [Gammaproteobacteria bacterium]MBT8106463.1 efflux RND transporter permease subunit [Gammaproteobacteria bacterium]NNK26478.1 efflux RND transporter permease subunit [Woeseiaceae bacterium]